MNSRKLQMELKVLSREITKMASRLARLRAQRDKLLEVYMKVKEIYPE